MNQFVVCVLIAFSMLLTPVAHAAGFGCGDEACHMSQQPKHDSGADKQQGDKLAGVTHHCCCSPVLHQNGFAAPDLGGPVAGGSISGPEVNTRSVVIGPALEPPSLA